ncbi:MAG: class I SAM-dependent methyltransferase [Candidatus Gracilibacteria bacterium]
MTKLYSQLARTYHGMYQTIFDYKEQFEFFNKLLRTYKCKKILEIGCGSGNLAPFFLKSNYNYLGLDLNKEMLAIAKEVAPKAKFIKADMRSFNLKQKFDAIIIPGRSFTYMTKNKDVMMALEQIHKHLKTNGILIFDNFNAEKIIIDRKTKHSVQESTVGDTKYKRVSKKTLSLNEGWTEKWDATYFVTTNGKTKTVKDSSVVRSFTKEELKLFLKLTGFDLIKNQTKDFSITTIAKKQ